MRLIDNWRIVLRHAWSIRLMALAALLSGAEVALPFVEPWLPIHEGFLALAAGLTTAAAFVARLVAQPPISGQVKWRG